MKNITRTQIMVPVQTPSEDTEHHFDICARIVLPTPSRSRERPIVFFCFPGGALTGAYFDLGEDDDRAYSFAQAMAEAGHVTVAFDHPGVGLSSRPEDGYALHPDLVAAADHAAVSAVMTRLREGLDGAAPLAGALAVGVGHSMGGVILGLMQNRFRPFSAVAILGSGPYGLAEHLPEALKPLTNDPQAARQQIAARLREASIPSYMDLTPTPESQAIFHGGDRRGVAAMKAARTNLIVLPGFFAMIPGSWAPEAASIDVPVLLAYGDRDICADPYATPSFFKGSGDVTLLVLRQTGHSHFIFPAREGLWRRIDQWANSMAG